MSLETTMFLGNNLVQWISYIAVLVLAIYGTKVVYYLFEKIFKVLTSKTKTNLDDMIVHALKGPIVLGVFQLGLWYGKGILTLSPYMNTVYDRIQEVLLIINIAWLVVRIADTVVAHYISPHTDEGVQIDKTAYPVIKRLIAFFIYLVALLFIIQAFGYQINSLLAGLGIGGLAFALAAQDILGNMFGGVTVVGSKPFVVGDRIQISGQDGFVRDISLRATTLETFEGTQVIIPNKVVTNEVLVNITREPARRVKFKLGVEYDTSIAKLEKAKKLITAIVKKNKSTRDESLVYFNEFADSSLNILVIYWIEDLDVILQAQDEINFEIKKAFEKEKIGFAFPTRTVYNKKG